MTLKPGLWVTQGHRKWFQFERPPMTSYCRSLVTMAISAGCRFWDIQCLMKKASEETQTLRAGCSKAEPKIFAPPQTPFSGAQDGQNLTSWRWSLPLPTNLVWSMHAISSYCGNSPTNTQTNPQTGPITTYCAAKRSTQCKYTSTTNLFLLGTASGGEWLAAGSGRQGSVARCRLGRRFLLRNQFRQRLWASATPAILFHFHSLGATTVLCTLLPPPSLCLSLSLSLSLSLCFSRHFSRWTWFYWS